MSTRIHLIANSHIDPVWLWDKYEGIDEVLNTFRSACDRLDEYAELSFTASSLQFYEWTHQYDRALFERIQTQVAEGRWEIAGGWWVEPDSNLPTAASLRQHAEISRQFTQTHFPGTEVEVAYLPDSFGHPATLPRILEETGFRYFVFCRPGRHEKGDLPADLFWWEYRGHRVLAYRVKHHYLQPQPDGGAREEELRRRLADPDFAAAGAHAFFFGMGDHGGGPTVREIDFYSQYMRDRPKNEEIAFSTCRQFFEAASLQPDIPTYSGDLHMHAVGCYSVMRDLKAGVRAAEQGLELAGRALAMAGRDTAVLAPLWKRTLFNQFHDILPGSCSPAAADMARADMGGVDEGWRTTAYEALKHLASSRPVQGAEGEFRVFNTLPFEVRRPLSIESFQYYREGAAFLDEEGREITVQEVLPSVRCNNRRWEFVDTLPARGFRSYRFGDEAAAAERGESTHFSPGAEISTEALRIGQGGVSAATETALLAPPRFIVLDDTSDTWGHGRRRYDEVIGTFERGHTAVVGGPVVERLYERWSYHRSSLEVVYSAYAGLDVVYVDVVVNWAEDRKILKMELTPTACAADTFEMQGPGGGIVRARNGDEMPLHHWVQMRGPEHTFSVLQDGAFACDCEGERLRVNLVRSNLYGFHDPVQLVEADPQSLTDQGLHRFRFGLHFGSWTELESEQQVAAFLEPGWVIREGQRRG